MRLGVDLGGTKTEIIALAEKGRAVLRERIPTPSSDYHAIVSGIRDLVLASERKLGQPGTVGVAIPGAVSVKTGLVKNANTTALIGRPLDNDLADALGRPVRLANDANCFTLSEATDGAAANCHIVFGIIAGTGIGGGICVGGQLLEGAHRIAGEWGHNPLPGPEPGELPGELCYCGRRGCIETWIGGPALARQYHARTGSALSADAVARAAEIGDVAAETVMADFLDRFARSVASLVNSLDPDAIVLGGGLSNIDRLVRELPGRVEAWCFGSEAVPHIVKNQHGDSSGVRGAAWLWREEEVLSGLPQ